MQFLHQIIVIVIGLILGSFLNVLIYRIPRGLSIVKPRSFCPHCNSKIRWYDNIPVISFIILLGKCRYCKKTISLRYPVVEIITPLSLLLVYKKFYFSYQFFGSIIFTLALITLAFIDLEHKILPDKITLSGFVFFLFYSFSNPSKNFLDGIIGSFLGAGILLLIYLLYYFIRKEEGLGFGDIKMMLMIGVFLGIAGTVLSLVIASLLGSLVGILIAVIMRKGMKHALPFGVFLSIGAYISLLWGREIIAFYWRIG